MNHFGEELKEARKRKKLTLEQASEDLKVVQDILRSMEDADIKSLDRLSNIKYLIYNYARYLNLDEVEIYKKYKEEAFKHPFKHQEEQEEIKKKRHSNEFYEKDISSPVAPLIKTKKTLPFSNFLLIGIIIFVVLLIFYLLVSFFRKDYFEKENKNEYYISFNYEVKGRI